MRIEFTITLQDFYMWGFYYLIGSLTIAMLILKVKHEDTLISLLCMVLLWPIVVVVMLFLLFRDFVRRVRSKK